MIKAGSITGRELCMILYEQNILNYDESQYNALASGATTAYDFMRGKIQTLEITPVSYTHLYGVFNILTRLRLKYGDKITYYYETTDASTTCTIKVPKGGEQES